MTTARGRNYDRYSRQEHHRRIAAAKQEARFAAHIAELNRRLRANPPEPCDWEDFDPADMQWKGY
jgi:hypothetical protein